MDVEDFSTKNYVSMKASWLLEYFLGAEVTALVCGWSKLNQNRSNQNECLLLSKVDNIQKPCLSLKSSFFS